MIKIFNTEMAIHYLEKNKDGKIFTFSGDEVSLEDVKSYDGEVEYRTFYSFYTEDLGGTKWEKYAELDIWDVDENDERAFLVDGYNAIIQHLQDELYEVKGSLNYIQKEQDRSYDSMIEYQEIIKKMATDFGADCPEEIRKKLKLQYTEYEDDYKNSFYILPDIMAAKHVAEQLKKWAFIPEGTDVIDGWYAVWSIGD